MESVKQGQSFPSHCHELTSAMIDTIVLFATPPAASTVAFIIPQRLITKQSRNPRDPSLRPSPKHRSLQLSSLSIPPLHAAVSDRTQSRVEDSKRQADQGRQKQSDKPPAADCQSSQSRSSRLRVSPAALGHCWAAATLFCSASAYIIPSP
jgi:hypothetical protein